MLSNPFDNAPAVFCMPNDMHISAIYDQVLDLFPYCRVVLYQHDLARHSVPYSSGYRLILLGAMRLELSW